MSKQTAEEAKAVEAKKLYLFEQLLRLTNAFQRFQQENYKGSDLISLVPRDGIFQWDLDDGVVLHRFYHSPEYTRIGPILQERIRFFPARAVFAPGSVHKPEARLLVPFEIDVSASDDQIWRELKEELEWYRKIAKIPNARRGRKAGLPNVYERDGVDEMVRSYKAVRDEGGVDRDENVLQATWRLHPQTKGKHPAFADDSDETNKLYQRTRYQYQQVKGWVEGL